METLLVLLTSTGLSLIVIPVMMRLASRLGMMDEPNARKVHKLPIPRVGGIGIIFGTLLTVALWVPINHLTLSFIVGATILLFFGVWDDRNTLGPKLKFLGQILAASSVVFLGDLYITLFPFLNQALPSPVGKLFTVFAMVGVINAINTSDGLDGLAGGLTLISLTAIVFLAYLVGSDITIVIVTIALIGGIFGFLRYNTYPATVFMGDAGSQFLGFNLGFLIIYLTQQADQNLAPLIALFLLGLPVIDIFSVMINRAQNGMSLFTATKTHLHHRVLHLGFRHKEAVVIIYAFQLTLIWSGFFLRYSDEWLIATWFLIIVSSIYISLHITEKYNWQAHSSQSQNIEMKPIVKMGSLFSQKYLVAVPRQFLEVAIPLYFVSMSLAVKEVPSDFGVFAAILFTSGLLLHFVMQQQYIKYTRAFVYLTAAFIVYLSFNHHPSWGIWFEEFELIYFIALLLVIAIAIRFGPKRRKEEFRTTAMDYLLVFIVASGLVISLTQTQNSPLSIFIVKLIIILYGCEILLVERRERIDWMKPALILTIGIISLRGLFHF